MQTKEMTVEELRNQVDSDRVVKILQEFDGQPNIKALATLACGIGILLGLETKTPQQLMACVAAVSFVMNDAAQLAIKDGVSDLAKLRYVMKENETVN